MTLMEFMTDCLNEVFGAEIRIPTISMWTLYSCLLP